MVLYSGALRKGHEKADKTRAKNLPRNEKKFLTRANFCDIFKKLSAKAEGNLYLVN